MLNALAAVILIGLMLVPMVNMLVGLVAGFMLWGYGGAVAGFFVGCAISSMFSEAYHG